MFDYILSEAPEILKSEDAILEDVPINDLHIDLGYQRPLSQKKVDAIAKDFSDIAAGVLLVNVRDDSNMYLMDGGHRAAAAKQAGRSKIRCLVWYGLTKDQESQVFVKCNTARKQPNAMELFKARLYSGDLKSQILLDAVEKAGLKMAPYSGGGLRKTHPEQVEAIRAIEQVYDKSDAQTLTFVLAFLHNCWPDDGRALYDKMILGFELFHRVYKGQYHIGLLQRKLSAMALDKFLRDTQSMAISFDSGGWKSVARMILRVYNSSKTQEKRLNDLF